MLGNPSQAGGGCGGFFSGYIAAEEAEERGVDIWVRSGGLVVTAEKNVIGEKQGNKMRWKTVSYLLSIRLIVFFSSSITLNSGGHFSCCCWFSPSTFEFNFHVYVISRVVWNLASSPSPAVSTKDFKKSSPLLLFSSGKMVADGGVDYVRPLEQINSRFPALHCVGDEGGVLVWIISMAENHITQGQFGLYQKATLSQQVSIFFVWRLFPLNFWMMNGFQLNFLSTTSSPISKKGKKKQNKITSLFLFLPVYPPPAKLNFCLSVFLLLALPPPRRPLSAALFSWLCAWGGGRGEEGEKEYQWNIRQERGAHLSAFLLFLPSSRPIELVTWINKQMLSAKAKQQACWVAYTGRIRNGKRNWSCNGGKVSGKIYPNLVLLPKEISEKMLLF